MSIERPRGVRDFGPAEMATRSFVELACGRLFESFGYRRVQSPTLEFLDLFSMKSGSDIKSHMYTLEDKSGRMLCLRPEATASVARMYASDLKMLPKPLRLHYSGQMFRYEEPQKGRYREFWQLGVELLGASGPAADAEAILVASECLTSLGLRHSLRLSHIGILRSILARQGFSAQEQDGIIQSLDKGDFERVKAKVKDPSFIGLLGLKGGREALEAASRLVSSAEAPMLSELSATLALLAAAGVAYDLDFSMARGLDYYTGVVFDARVEGLGSQNQVCGGGRYDNLVGLLGGPPTPAVGFAFGLDRLVESLQAQGVKIPVRGTDVCVIPVSEDVRTEAFGIAAAIRRADPSLVVDLELAGRKLNRGLQHASEMGARLAVIVGAKELAAGSVSVKDMSSANQENVAVVDLNKRLLSLLGPR